MHGRKCVVSTPGNYCERGGSNILHPGDPYLYSPLPRSALNIMFYHAENLSLCFKLQPAQEKGCSQFGVY